MLDTNQLTRDLSGLIAPYAGAQLPVGPLHRRPVLYLSDAHKLLRPELLTALIPDGQPAPGDYSPATSYGPYELAAQDSRLYESLRDANQGNPLSDSAYWRETTMLSSWYGRIERGSIGKLALQLAGAPPAAPLIDRQPLYGKEGNLQGVISRTGRFVGIRIRSRKRRLAVRLLRVGLQLTGPVTGLPLYVFHSSQAEPVATLDLTGSTSGRTVWVDANVRMVSGADDYYLLGYFEGDLPAGVQAVGAERGWDVTGCSSCFGSDYALAAARSPYLTIESVFVDSPAPGLMSWATEQLVTMQTWGLNALIDVRCDATSTLLDNRDLLLNGLLHQIACDVLEEIATSDRVNGIAAQVKPQAYVALNGQANTKSDYGLKGERDKIVRDLKAVLATVSSCIQTEAPRRGITLGSMFDYE